MTKKYLCGVDYRYEMDFNCADFYDFVEELKKKKLCWSSCGIVEIELDASGNEIMRTWLLLGNGIV